MSKLDELIQELCPDGVEYRALKDILTIKNGSDYKSFPTGDIPVYGSGGVIAYIDRFIYDKPSVLIPRKGSIDKLYYVETPFWNVDTIFYTDIDAGKALPKFIYHCLKREHLEKLNTAGGVPSLTQAVLNKVEIPVPPLEVQREIVRILDNFTELTAELTEKLTAELTARKKQYGYYRDRLLTFDTQENVVMLPLADVADISTGSSNTDDAVEGGEYPFYVRSQEPLRKNEYEYDEEAIITAGDGVGVGKVFHYVNGKYALHQRAYRIHPIASDLSGKYLYHYFVAKFPAYIGKQMYQGSVPSIRRPMLNKFEIAVPALNVQEKIVQVLDNFDAICADLNIGLPAEIEARQKQYEYYRDALLTFAETGTILAPASQPASQNLIRLIQYVFGFVWLELNDVIYSLNTGLNPRQFFRLNTDDATNYYITIREIRDGNIVPTEKTDLINDEALALCNNRSNLEVGDVLFSGTGTIGETAVIIKQPHNWNIKEGVYAIKPNKDMILPKFLRYLLTTEKIKQAYMKKVAGGTVKSIPMGELRKIKIPVPTVDTQTRVIELLDRFDAICNDLTSGLPAEIEARQKQYEYYRDKLLTFKPAE